MKFGSQSILTSLEMKEIISTPNAPLAIGPYSQANLVNGILYISGQIAINPATGKIVDGIEKETHQVMANLKEILAEVGMDFSHVVKVTVFMKNLDDFSKMNKIYASYFEENQYPARETVQVASLPKNVSVQISMIAHQI